MAKRRQPGTDASRPNARARDSERSRRIRRLLAMLGLMAATAIVTWFATTRFGTDETTASRHAPVLIQCESPDERYPGALFRCIVPPADRALDI